MADEIGYIYVCCHAFVMTIQNPEWFLMILKNDNHDGDEVSVD